VVLLADEGVQAAGVAADDLAAATSCGGDDVADVGTGEGGPAGLVLGADGLAAEADGFDEGGADAAHRVEDEVAMAGVGGDRVGGDPRQHLGRVGGRSRLQLADDALAMSRAAADYSELRQALFFDSTQNGAEPSWWVWNRGFLAVRIRPRLYKCEEAALVLSPGQHEVHGWARAWLFTAVSNPHHPKDQGTGFPVTRYRTFEGTDPARDSYLIDAPRELEEHGEWYRQLFYAFLALGIRVQLGVITHEYVKRRVINGPSAAGGEEHTTVTES
jgi:hypothetical protein